MSPRESPTCPSTERAVGWALHALEPDEELTVSLHVPDCPECQVAVRETEEVVASLAVAVEQVQPAPSLRASIMRAVDETPQMPRQRTGRHRADVGASSPTMPHRVIPMPVERAQRPASWLTRRRLVAASLALVAVIAIGGLAVRTAQLEQTKTQQAEAISELVNTLVPAGSPHAVLAATDGTTVGAVVLDAGKREVLTVGMPTNPDTATYVLWGLQGQNAPVALGTFDVATTDAALRPVGTLGSNESYSAYAVSIEPGRIAPAVPTTVTAKGIVI